MFCINMLSVFLTQNLWHFLRVPSYVFENITQNALASEMVNYFYIFQIGHTGTNPNLTLMTISIQ